MRVSVKLVVFRHPEPARWDTYASYCPATNNFCAFGSSVSEVVEKFKKILLRDLQNRLAYQNMKKLGMGNFGKFRNSSYLYRRIYVTRNQAYIRSNDY